MDSLAQLQAFRWQNDWSVLHETRLSIVDTPRPSCNRHANTEGFKNIYNAAVGSENERHTQEDPTAEWRAPGWSWDLRVLQKAGLKWACFAMPESSTKAIAQLPARSHAVMAEFTQISFSVPRADLISKTTYAGGWWFALCLSASALQRQPRVSPDRRATAICHSPASFVACHAGNTC